MRSVLFITSILIACIINMGAKTRFTKKPKLTNKDITFLEFKFKKETNDKKLSGEKKYILTILAARELKELNYKKEASEYYQKAQEMTVPFNKIEVALNLTNSEFTPSIFFYEVNLKMLIKNKLYEEAILSLNPDKLKTEEFSRFRIIYDLLNIKIKKRTVKNLYCFKDYQQDPESSYQYSSLICDALIDYLRDGKVGNDHLRIVEEYFLKQDMDEVYLLQLLREIKI